MAQTVSTRQFNNPVVGATVYTNRHLFEKVGRGSEYRAVALLQRVFEYGTLNYDITFDLPIQEYAPRTEVCGDQFNAWNDDVLAGNIPQIRKDTNILLVDGRGGGCANNPEGDQTGATAVGVTPLDDFAYQLTTRGMGNRGGAAASLLHEVAHTLGSPGPGKDHFGYGFNDHMTEEWFRTPAVSGNGLENQCGEFVPGRLYSPDVKYLFYHWCAITAFDLVGQDFATPPTEYPPTFNGLLAENADQLPRPSDTAGCSNDEDCAGDTFCEAGECIQCQSDADCEGSVTCVDGACIGCTQDSDCPADYNCVSGVCEQPDGQGSDPVTVAGIPIEVIGSTAALLWYYFLR